MWDWAKPILEGFVRRVLQTAGGYLIAWGIVDETQWPTIAAGATVAIVGYLWGLFRSDLPRAEGRVS